MKDLSLKEFELYENICKEKKFNTKKYGFKNEAMIVKQLLATFKKWKSNTKQKHVKPVLKKNTLNSTETAAKLLKPEKLKTLNREQKIINRIEIVLEKVNQTIERRLNFGKTSPNDFTL